MDKNLVNGMLAGAFLVALFALAYLFGEKLKTNNNYVAEQCIEWKTDE